MKFRKKPVIVDAVQWTGENGSEVASFCGSGYAFYENSVLIGTLEGVMGADIGDWIIRGVKGELYPCKDNIFRITYEKVEENG